MAGEGGFSTRPMGFDKGEVNEYIGNLRKKMNEIEAEKKQNEEKTRAAVKAAEEADSKIQAVKKECEEKIAEFEAQVRTERRNAEDLQNQVDDLKRKLKNSAQTSAAKAGASTAESEKQAVAIIEKANAEAREIVDKAKKTAHEIISGAGSAGGASSANNKEFIRALRSFMDTVGSGMKVLSEKAERLLGETAGANIEIPDFSAYSAPQAEIPKAKPAPAPAAAPSPAPTRASGNMNSIDDIFSSDMGDDDADMNVFGEEADIKPLDPQKPMHEVIDGFDLSDVGKSAEEESGVSEVEPFDEKPKGAEMLDGFDMELISQTVPSSAITADMGEDLASAVARENDKHAVRPSDGMGDFSMDSMDMGSMDSGSVDDGIDAMNALLGQMGAALESAGGSADLDLGSPEPENNSFDNSNPWADLQAQLNAMEQNVPSSSDRENTESNAIPADDDRKVPDADDSAIWNFGDDSSSDTSDDDMSADLFGSF